VRAPAGAAKKLLGTTFSSVTGAARAICMMSGDARDGVRQIGPTTMRSTFRNWQRHGGSGLGAVTRPAAPRAAF